MEKNEIYATKAVDVTLEGNAICLIDGMVVFVPGCVTGDEAEIRIVKVQKRFAYGRLEKIITPSPDRQEPFCEKKRCGGCVFSHMSYAGELKIKEKSVRDCFTRMAHLEPKFLPILGCENRLRYRNKAQYPFAVDKDGKAVLGFFAQRSHTVIPVEDCQLQPQIFSDIAKFVLTYVNHNHWKVYNERNGSGELRHLYLRTGAHSGEVMVCFIVRSRKYTESLRELGQNLQKKFPAITSVMLNINPDNTNVVLGKQSVCLCGKPVIEDTMCGIPVQISPEAFYQVNTLQAEKLYGVGKTFADLQGTETLLDLYCGAGTIGLSMADSVKKLYGVEIVPEAVENAKRNAKSAHVTNAEFFCGDAGTVAGQFAEKQMHPDIIVVDPPRKGCDTPTLDALVTMAPSRIVMISCNPSTAARDCGYLHEKGYAVEKVQAVDLFPGTGHVETVVLLSYQNKTDDSV